MLGVPLQMNKLKLYVDVMLAGMLCLFGMGCVTARTVSMCYGADRASMTRGGFVSQRDIHYADYVRQNLQEIMGQDKRYMSVAPGSRYVEIAISGDMNQREADAYGKKVEAYRAKHPEVCPIKLVVTILPDEPGR